MRSVTLQLLALVLVACVAYEATASSSPLACQELGFDSSTVRCSHCSLLLQHTNDVALYDECGQCCTTTGDDEDSSASNAKVATYYRGRLEMDMRGLYPGSELARFVNEFSEKFEGLSVQDTPRMQPRIVLLEEDGSVGETTRVQSWRCDLIVEYLQKKLVPAPKGAKKGGFWGS
ncbi:Hypothetical protein, putative [Bodo saltans]|uniref:Selenoprotein F n=1 Tax=Bodo saltans TaxID=75058 RepID=A0A0S4JU13_BODSA|nr:Hypothetical protein, putative [Bodo saltans]|eukprot:CUG93884.1 Hypothetical protein, putative [Bodo saltans]